MFTMQSRMDTTQTGQASSLPQPQLPLNRMGQASSLPLERLHHLFANVETPAEGCWLWVNSCTNRGYGRINTKSGTTLAHRIAYEAVNGPVPEGLELDHLCRVHECVRPDHLEAVTHQENMLRSPLVGAGRTHIARYKCQNSE